MWIKLDKENLPEIEVLAANFKAKTYGYKEKCIGYLNEELGEISCENEHELLGGCTHYVPIHDYDLEA
jgi:hypothetical protein